MEELTPSFSMSKIRYCSFASMRFNFFFFSLSLFATRPSGVAPALQPAGLSFAAYFRRGRTAPPVASGPPYDSKRANAQQSGPSEWIKTERGEPWRPLPLL